MPGHTLSSRPITRTLTIDGMRVWNARRRLLLVAEAASGAAAAVTGRVRLGRRRCLGLGLILDAWPAG